MNSIPIFLNSSQGHDCDRMQLEGRTCTSTASVMHCQCPLPLTAHCQSLQRNNTACKDIPSPFSRESLTLSEAPPAAETGTAHRANQTYFRALPSFLMHPLH